MSALLLPMLLSAAVILAGCASGSARSSGKTAGAAGAAAGGAAGGALPEPDVREASLRVVPEVKAIHFDYDSSYLSPAARAVLVQNAGWLKSHPEARVQAAGNCDERGTVEYNLALGQRRALAVRKYYKALGVSAERIATISYGEEKPLCRESNEDCWRMNRRVESLVSAPEVAGPVDEASSSR
jgi:peptidoglycan-associated lipoprotein